MTDTAHIEACTALLTGDEQTEYHYGPGECPACRKEQAAISEAERYADFGMGWVTSGGDPADARLAWSQDKALIAEREHQQREDEEATARERAAVTRPKDRPVTGWRKHHRNFFGTGPAFKGEWEYEPGCGCAKCFNHDLSIQDCLGDWEYVE